MRDKKEKSCCVRIGELWRPTLTGDLKSRLTLVMYIVKACSPAVCERGKATSSSLLRKRYVPIQEHCLVSFASTSSFSWHCELKGKLLFKSLLFTSDYERGQQLSNDLQAGMLYYMLKYTSQISKQQQCSLLEF